MKLFIAGSVEEYNEIAKKLAKHSNIERAETGDILALAWWMDTPNSREKMVVICPDFVVDLAEILDELELAAKNTKNGVKGPSFEIFV